MTTTTQAETQTPTMPHFSDSELRPVRCGDVLLKPQADGTHYDLTPSINLDRERLKQIREAIGFLLAQDARPPPPRKPPPENVVSQRGGNNSGIPPRERVAKGTAR